MRYQRFGSPLRALAGCLPFALAGQTGLARGATERVIYSFQGGSDGAFPLAGLTYSGGQLYGTTSGGGTANDGTVFKLTTSGVETVLHSFQGGEDGNFPLSNLLDVDGTLYGTTLAGGLIREPGKPGDGTIFTVSPSGAVSVVYAFHPSIGKHPQGGLIKVGDSLYGTTTEGGVNNNGTVYKFTKRNTAVRVYAFQDATDGSRPVGDLLDLNGTLYGTAVNGGDGVGGNFNGSVFALTRAGSESVLHEFNDHGDGDPSTGGLVKQGGTLYGTTSYGGADNAGTIFSLTQAGVERRLHDFSDADHSGVVPNPLTRVGGKFFGTTSYGGETIPGLGVVFSVTPEGVEKVIHFFQGGSDGANPEGTLVEVNGTLYGTTYRGGATNNGTVFAITP